jgi:hypothetical protein
MTEHPMWFASKLTTEEIRINAAWMLSNPEFQKFEVWNGGRLAGMLLLSRVISPIDALFHFTFFNGKDSGTTLFGAKKLIHNFLGWAFEQYDLQRISMEIPEHYPKLIRYARQKLGFRYESEGDCDRFNRLKSRLKDQSESMRSAIALHGSRRENAHWDPKTETWSDIVLLRLLRREYQSSLASPGPEPYATRETLPEVSLESRVQVSPVRSSPGT